jgi:very-short-patch-repair endonuclease
VRAAQLTQTLSGLEEKAYRVLDEWGVQYMPQYRIGQYVVDAYLPQRKLVVELMGCFWHGCFLCGYGDAAKLAHDRRRAERLQAQGYQVIEVWEHEVKRDPYEALNAAFRRTQLAR